MALLRALFLKTTTNDWWTYILLWIVRITTLSLLLRTYLIPWLFAALSKHVRMRSVSLWSIRGLYVRKGARVYRVDRVSYGWSRCSGLNVRFDGLHVEIGRDLERPAAPIRRHNRSLTLADFAPSPMARRLWGVLSRSYALVEPYFRPLIRTCVVACLRVLIRWLPHIVSNLTFDLHSTSLTFSEVPGTQISVEKISLQTSLSFTQLDKVADAVILDRLRRPSKSRPSKPRRSYGVAAWRRRFAHSFQRTLARAWGTAHGTAALTLKLNRMAGSMQSTPEETIQFLRLPGAIVFDASLGFNPREASLDTHSLTTNLDIGDSFIKLDALNLLLKSLKRHEPPLPTLDVPEEILPASPWPFFSPTSSIGTPNSANTGGSAMFSPHSSIVSPQTESPPLSALLSPDVMSPVPQGSPFLEVLSASIRHRRRHPHQPCVRLKETRNTSILSILEHASVKLSSITLSAQPSWGIGLYETVIQDVTLGAGLDDDSNQPGLHQYWMGRGKRMDSYDPDTYGLKISIQKIGLERRTRLSSMRLLTIGTMDFQALTTQWPAPWLTPSPFMCGDPNAPFLAIRAKIQGLDLLERVECLRQLIAAMEHSTKQPPNQLAVPSKSFQLPRLALQVQCGTIRGQIICADSGDFEPFAVELRSNGFLISAESSFKREPHPSPRQSSAPDYSKQPLRMDYTLSIILDPTFVHVRSGTAVETRNFAELRTSDPGFQDDPSILSLDSFEIHGEGHAIASLLHDTDNVASVSSASPILDLHILTDALCIELWNPRVMMSIQQILSILPAQKGKPSRPLPPATMPLLDRLPTGVSITMALARFVVLITAPDLNPRDTLELSRGFAVRTGLFVHYSSMHSGHAHRFHDLPQRTQTRNKLYLPQELVVDAVSAARASAITHNASAHFRVCFSNLALRSAVATQYDSDNPLIFEQDDHALEQLEFLRIPNIRVNLCLTGKRGPIPSKSADNCEISAVVAEIRATFQLSYVYAIMLALRSVKLLVPPSLSPSHHRPASHSSRVSYRFKVSITTVQALWIFPTQRVAIRIDGIDSHVLPNEPLSIRLTKVVGWVRLPSRVNKWDDDNGYKWEEMLELHALSLSFPPLPGTPSISVESDSARLRIPFGYVLADLITDIAVTVKAVRHLGHITTAGQYMDMPTPEAEGPKAVPNLTVRIRCLCFEASDDSLESKLAVIWRCGIEAAKQRLEREEAFMAKVAAIYQAESEVPASESAELDKEYNFGATHSVSIEEARRRLNEVHELDWTLRLQNIRTKHAQSEDVVNQGLRDIHAVRGASAIPNIVEVTPTEQIPPLFRALLNGVSLAVQAPSFPGERLPDFLHEQGGLPRDTHYSLLVPLHLQFVLSSLHITLRDYPLPLFSIPPHTDPSIAAWDFETDLVIAEEMGSELSVDWIPCPILEPHQGALGAAPLTISVPKTIMPVKTYANPVVHVTTKAATIISWSVSYTPAVQDFMKVMETISSSPRDSSPGVGFWDKIRLLFHWSLVASFKGEVRYHMKGSRDPYVLADEGAGFVLSFQGNTKLLIGRKNDDGELIQVISDSMFIAIPNLEHLYSRNWRPSYTRRIPENPRPFRKICAKLRSGVRFGVGFVLERACGDECHECSGSAFHRKCRHFDFLPHYRVRLEKKTGVPAIKGPEDSYNGFRSDFIHLSISLASSTRSGVPGSGHNHEPSSIHLTPKAFTHFWAWCDLFDSTLSLPTRQGSYYPARLISPKLGRHLATLKYRVHLHRLFFMHAYIDESRETWVDGVIPWIGVKGVVDEFQADMHQRDEESIVTGPLPDTTKVLRRKPFYAAEVALRGLDLRALLATFDEPLRKDIEMTAPPQRSNYRSHQNLPSTAASSIWHDPDDFIEIDWSPSIEPDLHLLPVVTCPHFTYFKRNSAALGNANDVSKFGLEKSHTCMVGKGPTVPQVQIAIATHRIRELRKLIRVNRSTSDNGKTPASLEKMMALLEDYIALLEEEPEKTSDGSAEKNAKSYLMPSYTVSPDEWAEFKNVYQVHCPKIIMTSAIRDIMVQYYYCSRARRGFEYHMATRAVKFIRDQAEAALETDSDFEHDDPEKLWGATATAQMAASALKKFLKVDQLRPSAEVSRDPGVPVLEEVDPLSGWSEGVSLSKNHCCLLLKPQIVMRGEGAKDALIVAAVQAKLQIFAIMDDSNADDPISGKVMSRSYTSVSGLQTFAPASITASDDLYVPLEVLMDLRCESNDFDRLVPQTDATFRYDKFNRLRLRNNITSVTRTSEDKAVLASDRHLQDQTDLVQVHIPRFTVSANDEHFQAISNIVTKLLLFSDAAHKIRLEKLETLLFTYDFTDLASAAKVVADLQGRLGEAMESRRTAENNHSRRLEEREGQLELLKLKAHIFLLSEELNFLFDAIKLAQDRFDDHTDPKSALLLHASSSEISWRMLDDRRDLLAKLVVQDIDYYWLSRQDSSTGNNLSVGNLQAFDGSRYALWAEILSKYNEPANHPLLKRGLFLLASWTVLAPVGGITIYESFELSLHPMRLQIDARVGRRIMDYLWPARRHRHDIGDAKNEGTVVPPRPPIGDRTSLDSPRTLHGFRTVPETNGNELKPPMLRRLGSSRSFTDLRASRRDTLGMLSMHKAPSSETLRQNSMAPDNKAKDELIKKAGDAAEMKTRASQKSFVLVRISSLNLLLSVVKEGSFECHDARIRTRDLEYRNQTWSFEELVSQFIPSDTSWRGWVKMAFHQPLLPVLPVARELFSKTKWIASSSKAAPQVDLKGPPPKLPRAKALSIDDDSKLALVHGKRANSKSPSRGWRKASRRKPEPLPAKIMALPLTDEPESLDVETERPSRSTGRKRLKSLFSRGSSRGDAMSSSTTLRPSEERQR
ncbi:hypothetical protein Hypma_010076 [Hypsizygus marmoreus]|uniref:Uncharacterized protein n=1 Tax=Hypsizygus marmoreus TaxID=39966 RepID=A0A369JKV8_HYPMA|nr:hypothetical protein Hypma_010076 [Hypsizygus marmoreus]